MHSRIHTWAGKNLNAGENEEPAPSNLVPLVGGVNPHPAPHAHGVSDAVLLRTKLCFQHNLNFKTLDFIVYYSLIFETTLTQYLTCNNMLKSFHIIVVTVAWPRKKKVSKLYKRSFVYTRVFQSSNPISAKFT